uniref:Gag-Pol polyprotein n=1 Tax=Tanacetum cinerariifolium TaxID=118510 RepID=A0A699U4B3_TANCI|nr:Gag-Pol polyprotein [Tanacetum cinerariifolium]
MGYSPNSAAYKVYNQRTKKIMETMNITFDELSAMAFEQNSSRPGLQSITSGQIGSELELTYAPLTITPQRPNSVEGVAKGLTNKSPLNTTFEASAAADAADNGA